MAVQICRMKESNLESFVKFLKVVVMLMIGLNIGEEMMAVVVIVMVMVVEVVMLVDEKVWKWKLGDMVSVVVVMVENM